MRALLVASSALVLSGCFASGYLAQAAGGEYEILHGARPISKVLAEPGTPPRTRRLLSSVRSVKAFGQAHGLKPTRNYESYTDLHRPAAVWVVQACAPLAFDVRRWHFPLVGSVPYLGFFDEGAARRYAASLASAEGLDIEVRTASAFSTLGWFRDPVLSTMLPEGDGAVGGLANVILHESVHATLYLPNQSAFNESLASFIADGLTPSWLASTVGPKAPEAVAWERTQKRRQVWDERMHRAYVELDTLYRSNQSPQHKTAEKALLLAEVRDELGLEKPLNNATLAGDQDYATGVPELQRLLTTCGGSWRRMLKTLSSLEGSDFDEPQQRQFGVVIDRLAARGCGPGLPPRPRPPKQPS
ncbi:MAG: aminopeptidase [Myxococcaceae bacterium]